MKELAAIIVVINACFMVMWTWRAFRFARVYNLCVPEATKPVTLAGLALGMPAAGQGVVWLLQDGYKACQAPEVVKQGDSLKNFTILTGLFSLTIPLLAALWFQGMV